MPAGTAPTARIAWADGFHLNSNGLCLVCDLKSHIGVGPAMDFGTEVFAFAQRHVSDVAEVFDHDASCSDLNRVTNQCFGCDMQKVSRYGSLVSGHPAKQASGRLGANGLDGSTSATDAGTSVVQLTTVEEKRLCVIRVGGYEHSLYAHVHSDKAAFGFGFWYFCLVSENQIPLFADSLDLRVLPSSIWKGTRIVNGKQVAPQRYPLLGAIEVTLPYYRHDRLREPRQSPSLVGLGGFVGSTDGFAQRTCKLRRQPHLSEIGVVRLGEPIRVQFISFESDLREPVRGFDPSQKKCVGFCTAGYLKFNCSDSFHWFV